MKSTKSGNPCLGTKKSLKVTYVLTLLGNLCHGISQLAVSF